MVQICGLYFNKMVIKSTDPPNFRPSKNTCCTTLREVDGLYFKGEWMVCFYCNWADYDKGFGDLNGEFWLGLNKIN